MNIWVGGVDIGTTARGLGQTVAQRVLGAQGREARVAQLLGHAAGGDGNGGAGADDVLPGDVVNAIVQLIGILRLKRPSTANTRLASATTDRRGSLLRARPQT